MLGRPRVEHLEALVEVLDEHVRALVGEGRLDPLAVPGGGDLADQLGVDGVEQLGAVGDEQAGRLRVVLGLRDEVGGDVGGHGGGVGEDADLGRAGLGVDGAAALHQALGGGDVDVARPGDDVDGDAAPRRPRQPYASMRDRLRAADGVHLVDAEQRAGGEHDRVRQAVGLRRAGDRERARRPRPGPGTTFMTTLLG